MSDNRTSKWSEGLWFVQCAKNRRLNNGIGRSPYEAMFGKKMEIGITSLGLSSAVMSSIRDEDDLDAVLSGQLAQTDDNKNELDTATHKELASTDIVEEVDLPPSIVEEDLLTVRLSSIAHHRDGARKRQKAQAEKMLDRSCKRWVIFS